MRTYLPGGKAEQLGWPPELFDPKQLAIGVRVEMEHTNDPKLAQEIAMDHLAEQVLAGEAQDYYTRLIRMENEMQPNVSIGGDPEHPAFQHGRKHGKEDLAKGLHGDPRASYEAWLNSMAKQGKIQSWMYDPDSKTQYLYGYDSLRRGGYQRNANLDYEKASSMAAELAATGLGAWPIAVKLREAGFDKAMSDGIAIVTEQRRVADRRQFDPMGVRTRVGRQLQEVENTDPFWRSHYSEEQMERARQIPSLPTEPAAFVVHGDSPKVEMTEEEVLADLRTQLNDRAINRQQYAEEVRRLRNEQATGKTMFLRNPGFTEQEAFAALQTRLATPIKFAAIQIESGYPPDQATKLSSAKYGLSELDTKILRYIMDSYESVPLVANRKLSSNRTSLAIGSKALYNDEDVVQIIGYERGRVVVMMPDGKPEIVSHNELSHDAYEIRVAAAMSLLMEGTDPAHVVRELMSDGDVNEEFALSAMEDAAKRISEAS